MVKNNGGNKAKGFARKNLIKGSHALRTSEDPAEIYAQAIKVMGGSMCRVNDLLGREINCHIRGKFRGRGKRDNLIVPGSWLLVGLREWELEPNSGKLLNCDLIEVYSDSDKARLKSSILNVDWTPFNVKSISDDPSSEIEFSDDKTQEYQALIEAHLSAGKGAAIISEDVEEINVDDI